LTISWEKFLQKLEEGKREATEGEFKRISLAYSKPMTAAVRMAVEKEMNEEGVLMRALQFLSVMTADPIPLEYVVQYVIRCMPDEDEELVAANISTSSLILTSLDESEEIRVHQIVHSCLQTVDLHNDRDVEFAFLVNVIHAFSNLLNSFDVDNFHHIVTTRSLVMHFTNLAIKLNAFVSHASSQMLEKLQSEENNKTTSCVSSMAIICITQSKYEASCTYSKICLKIQESAYDQNHPALASTLCYLGGSLRYLGEYKEAKECLERSLLIQEMSSDQNHPHLVSTLNHLGASLEGLGQHEEASRCIKRALAIQEKAKDENHPGLITSFRNLAKSLQDLGQYEEARKFFDRALAMEESDGHQIVAITFGN
jgi:hypothetical protein